MSKKGIRIKSTDLLSLPSHLLDKINQALVQTEVDRQDEEERVIMAAIRTGGPALITCKHCAKSFNIHFTNEESQA